MAVDYNDKTANGNNLTNHGTTEWVTDFPFADSTEAIKLVAASTQYADAVSSATLNISGDQTYECWFKFDTLPASGNAFYMFGKGDVFNSTGQHRTGIGYDGVNYYFQMMVSGTGADADYHNINFLSAPSTGTWYHLAWIWTSSSHTLEAVLNGTSQGTSSTGTITTLHTGTDAFELGNAIYNSVHDQLCNGKMDDARVWGVAKTAAQINTSKSVELTGSESNLNAYWPFESTLGTTTSTSTTSSSSSTSSTSSSSSTSSTSSSTSHTTSSSSTSSTSSSTSSTSSSSSTSSTSSSTSSTSSSTSHTTSSSSTSSTSSSSSTSSTSSSSSTSSTSSSTSSTSSSTSSTSSSSSTSHTTSSSSTSSTSSSSSTSSTSSSSSTSSTSSSSSTSSTSSSSSTSTTSTSSSTSSTSSSSSTSTTTTLAVIHEDTEGFDIMESMVRIDVRDEI